MKIARYEYNGEIGYGEIDGKNIYELEGDIFDDFKRADDSYNIEEVKLLTPIEVPNIIAIGLNYRKHALESGIKLPERPIIFLKSTTSVIGPNEEIILPDNAADEVDYEAELAIVIGKKAKNVSVEDAEEYILGYTCANDVSARDCQIRIDKQWARAKSFDTFCPLGPWIETKLDADNVSISSTLNGKVMQNSNTSDMIFNTKELVSYISSNMTLLPGTIIMTGTPEGVGFARKPPVFLQSGDEIVIEIEGLGSLRNFVR